MENSNLLCLDIKESTTVDMYNAKAEKWAKTSDGNDLNGNYLWTQEMENFHKLATKAPHSADGRQILLEVGSGTGRDAKLLSKQYEYLGIDASESFVELARRNTEGMLPLDAFRLMSVYDLKENFPPGSFDLFWVCATLLHCSKHRMQEALGSIHSVVKNGAVGFITLKEGDGEELDHYDGLPRYFTYWQDTDFVGELKQAGFTIIESHKKLSGRLPFLCYFIQKA